MPITNIPNEETIRAIEEIKKLKEDPEKKIYANFSELLEERQHEI